MRMWRCRASPISSRRISSNSTDPLVQHSTPETQELMAKQAADIRERIATTDQRFRVMDDMGVDMQLVCPAPPQIYYNLPLDVGVAGGARSQ